ncbi:pirin, partial [Thalassolituus sp. HI0120]
NFGWLNSQHSFSFGHYYDPKHMGFSALRVINDDSVAPGAGFDTHGHRDMEIISYVLEGAIEHKDSMGHSYIVPAGDVQRMSAGTGVTHSEFNHSKQHNLRFLQIWIQPNKLGITPGYQQQKIEQRGKLTPLVTPDGSDGSLSIQQDVSLYRVALNRGESLQL